MRKIVNPYVILDGYTCFGCAPGNDIGLRFEFYEDGDEIVATWTPDARYCGFQGVLHGGIQATAHDEIASWVVYVKCATSGFTQSLSVDYKVPVLISKGEIALRARLDRMEENVAVIATELKDSSGTLCSSSIARYYTVPAHIAKRKFAYPGIEAFFPDRG
jgi:acyl-coenzyme A thioesterase PaaI-like protein